MANEDERQVRMKSVGLLAVGYLDLHLHMDFLQRQVRWVELRISLSLSSPPPPIESYIL